MRERQDRGILQNLREPIERGTDSKRAVERLVGYGTEETYDWLNTLEVMSIGAAAALRTGKTREAGLNVLRGVDSWLERAPFGIVFKTLLPTSGEGSDDVDGGSEARERHNRLNFQRLQERIEFLKVLEHPFFVRNNLSHLYLDTARSIQNIFTNGILDDPIETADVQPFPVVRSLALNLMNPERARVISIINQRQQEIIREYYAASEGEKFDHMRYADRVIGILPTIPRLEPNPQIMDVRIGRVSLSELYQSDGENFLAAYLEIIANLPKGDLFSQALRGMAFIPQVGNLVDIPDDLFKDPDFSNKIFSAQETIVDHLVMPAASQMPGLDEVFREFNKDTGIFVNRALDNGIRAAVTVLEPRQQREFAASLVTAAAFGDVRAEMMRRWEGGNAEDQFYDIDFDPTSFISLAAMYLKESSQNLTLESHDSLLFRFLNQAYPHMEVNWKQRFESDFKAMGPFFEVLEKSFELPYEDLQAQFVLDRIKENIGENFINQLEGHTEELANVSQDIIQQLYRRPRKFWPSDSALHRIGFGEKTLAGILGMNTISYHIPDDPKDAVHFIIRFNNDTLHLPGSITASDEENTVALGVNLPDNADALKTLIEHISISYFYDLLTVSGDTPLKRKDSQEDKDNLPKGLHVVQERKVRLPRYERVEEEIVWDAEEITTAAVGEKEKAIRRITMYVRGVPGSIPFMKAVGSYLNHAVIFEGDQARLNVNADDALLANRESNIQNSWSRMAHPSPAKLAQIERMPKVWRSEIRYIGDRPIDTVVADHWNPRPPDEIIGSPELMYANYYSAPTDSKTAYLDYVSLWMFGNDMGIEPEPDNSGVEE